MGSLLSSRDHIAVSSSHGHQQLRALASCLVDNRRVRSLGEERDSRSSCWARGRHRSRVVVRCFGGSNGVESGLRGGFRPGACLP
jgi:hypothetical protein